MGFFHTRLREEKISMTLPKLTSTYSRDFSRSQYVLKHLLNDNFVDLWGNVFDCCFQNTHLHTLEVFLEKQTWFLHSCLRGILRKIFVLTSLWESNEHSVQKVTADVFKNTSIFLEKKFVATAVFGWEIQFSIFFTFGETCRLRLSKLFDRWQHGHLRRTQTLECFRKVAFVRNLKNDT